MPNDFFHFISDFSLQLTCLKTSVVKCFSQRKRKEGSSHMLKYFIAKFEKKSQDVYTVLALQVQENFFKCWFLEQIHNV